MSSIRFLAWMAAAMLVCGASAAEPGKVTGSATYLTVSGKQDGKSFGFIGMCGLEIDEQPAAAFGLYQAPGQKSQYTYLVLFKPNPKAERGSGHGGGGEAQNNSDGHVKCDLAMQALVGGHEIKVRLQLERDAKTVAKNIVTIGGQDYGPDGPRVFLVDLAAEKPVPLAVKYTPSAVPEPADETAWGQQILAAKKELIEKSPEAKRFFGGE
jgi:hypothetical protein